MMSLQNDRERNKNFKGGRKRLDPARSKSPSKSTRPRLPSRNKPTSTLCRRANEANIAVVLCTESEGGEDDLLLQQREL
jgi:hypothetical protein